MSNVNSSNTAPESFAELPERETVVDEVLKSTYLWTALRRLHEDLNAKTRHSSQSKLPLDAIHLSNLLLSDVHDFVGDFHDARTLPKFDEASPPTYVDALVTIGLYKRTLRAYMIEMLGKNPYTLT